MLNPAARCLRRMPPKMMMKVGIAVKKTILWLLVLTLALAAPAMALGVTLETVLDDVRSIEYVDETNYLLVRSNDTRLYGLYNTAGEQLIPCEYGYLDHADYGFFEVINEEGLNNHALLDANGNVVIDYKYAAFEMLSPRWCAAVTLEETEGEDYDYSGGFFGGGAHYIATGYDFYDLSEGRLAGTLTRDEYYRCTPYDGYLFIENRDDEITVYDANLTALDAQVDYLHKGYDVVDGNAVCVADGKVIRESVNNVSYDSDSGYIKVWGKAAGVGLYDSEGNELIPCEYESIGMVYDGFVTVEINDLTGLYDLINKKLVVPCEYDDIHWFGLSTATRYVHNGYACVEKDGKVGFVDMEGNVTCEVKYLASGVTEHGCSLTLPDIDGSLYIIAADGTQTKTDFDEISEYSGGDGSLLVVKKGEDYGLVDWHGEEVLPLQYKSYDIEITNDADAVIVADTLMVRK